jgi:hypothetical protein
LQASKPIKSNLNQLNQAVHGAQSHTALRLSYPRLAALLLLLLLQLLQLWLPLSFDNCANAHQQQRTSHGGA